METQVTNSLGRLPLFHLCGGSFLLSVFLSPHFTYSADRRSTMHLRLFQSEGITVMCVASGAGSSRTRLWLNFMPTMWSRTCWVGLGWNNQTSDCVKKNLVWKVIAWQMRVIQPKCQIKYCKITMSKRQKWKWKFSLLKELSIIKEKVLHQYGNMSSSHFFKVTLTMLLLCTLGKIIMTVH